MSNEIKFKVTVDHPLLKAVALLSDVVRGMMLQHPDTYNHERDKMEEVRELLLDAMSKDD